MEKKRIIFMRHGSIYANRDAYENMDYNEFMSYLLKTKNPPLKKTFEKNNNLTKSDEYLQLKNAKIDTSLKDIDAIFPSPARRALETANLIQDYFKGRPKIVRKVKDLLAEVRFYEKILSRQEFDENGGWNGCRPKVLKRWFNGENSEPFEISFARVRQLDLFLRRSPHKTILLITHGIFLRMIFMFYNEQLKIDKSGNLIKDKATLRNLLAAPRLKYGGSFRFDINGMIGFVENETEKGNEKILMANVSESEYKKVKKTLFEKNSMKMALTKAFN